MSNLIRDKISSTLNQKAIEPQFRTELHHISVQLNSADAELITIQFNYRYYDEPTIIKGNSSVSYKDADGNKYKVGLLMTVQEYLADKTSGAILGAKVFVRARELPQKLKYPIYGQLDVVVMGKATSRYLGALDDAIPYIPQDGSLTDDSKEFENDPPPAVSTLALTAGVYYSKDDGKGQTPLGFIKATWQPVVHNDLQGYESDISEGDNQHYDDKPDPKFSSSTMMAWTGLKLGTTYYVRVRAVDLAGNTSDWIESSVEVPIDNTISAPTNLQANSQPPRGIVLTWTASTTANVFSYEVYRSATDDISTATKIGEVQGTVYFDNNLNTDTTYYYWVRAVSTSGTYSSYAGSVSAQAYKLQDVDVQAGSLYNALSEIDENKLADNAVSASKIQAGAITANKIATGALLTYNGTFVNRLKKNLLSAYVYPNATKGNEYVYIPAGQVELVSYTSQGWSTITVNTNAIYVYGVNSTSSVYKYIFVYFIPNVDTEDNPIADTYNLTYSFDYPTDPHAIVLFLLTNYYSSNLGQYTFDVQTLGAMGTIINGDHIQTGSITAQNIAAGTITADKIQAGAITADKISVSSLSSINANLGTITAGFIQSNNGASYWDLNNNTLYLNGGTFTAGTITASNIETVNNAGQIKLIGQAGFTPQIYFFDGNGNGIGYLQYGYSNKGFSSIVLGLVSSNRFYVGGYLELNSSLEITENNDIFFDTTNSSYPTCSLWVDGSQNPPKLMFGNTVIAIYS